MDDTDLNADELAASIVSEAQRNAQTELRATSEILKLAGVVLRDRASSFSGGNNINRIPPSLQNADKRNFSSSPASTSPISNIIGGISNSSINSGPLHDRSAINSLSDDEETGSNIAIPEYSNLPGKFGSLSFSESAELTNSPTNRTKLLSKLDGLEGSTTPRRLDRTIGNNYASNNVGNDFSISAVSPRSRSVIEEAIGNASGGSERVKYISRKPHGHNQTTTTLSNTAMGEMEIARLPKVSLSEMMPAWVKRKIIAESTGTRKSGVSYSTQSTSSDQQQHYYGQYEIHSSETIISHEFYRGNWTWAVEWSPDGKYLALATENHDLAIVDAGMSSSLWKVIHDDRIGTLKNDTTHTIRAIAWGNTFIAIGGTGDAVSIIEPYLSGSLSVWPSGITKQSFRVVDIITETGFVGALSWQKNSNVLAIGNREDQCLVVDVCRENDGSVNTHILHNVERSDWVNAVRFSPGGTKLAIGDRSGLLSVFLFVVVEQGEPPALSSLQDITMEDNILDIQWAPDAKYVYVGGEDFCITVIGASKWDVLQKIGRDRWVPFLAPSRGGSYLVAGGAENHVSLFDVKSEWKEVTSLPLDGGIPLFAKWHPKDQYLAVSGQFNDVIVYETSCRRLLEGKCLRSKSAVISVDFSPNGKMLAIGIETGIISIFDATSSTFVTLYETVIGTGGDVTLRWSPSGRVIAISSGSTFVLLDTVYSGEPGKHPQNNSRFFVRKVIQGGVNFASLAFSPKTEWLALTDVRTQILDIKNDCNCVKMLDQDNVLSSGWCPDGTLFALVGMRENVSIYDTTAKSPSDWEVLFSISFDITVNTLCWGPSVKKGLQYLAFGGDDKRVTVLEIRTFEQTWEEILGIPNDSNINDLDWNDKGLLCIGDDNGVVSIVDLSYLKSGRAVNEMNYNWQRQGLICTMKLTRNLGRNAITALRWLSSDILRNNRNLLVIGGSDGVIEIVDMTDGR
ncbi:hypothetical protein ACHAXS_013119 [Conticribra weissflogii]